MANERDEDVHCVVVMVPSVIICTRNRATRLRGVFDCFAKVIGARDAQFLVVDSGSTDHTQLVLRQIAETSSLRIQILTADRPGLGHAQNVALAAATGDPLIFTDDDCFPDNDWLVQWAAVFEDARIGYAGGRIELHNDNDAAITINTSRSPDLYPPRSFLLPGTIQGANMAFRHEVLRRIGGFDRRFGSGGPFRSGSDIEATARASAAGWWGGYFPGPAVSHDHGRKTADVDAIFANYDHGRGAYYAKFILDKRTRRVYVRNVGSRWRFSIVHDRKRLWREAVGALHFIWSDRLLKRTRLVSI